MKTKPLILIADDEENFLEIISAYLESMGFRTASLLVKDAGEIVRRCEEILPDLLLLDVYIGGEPRGIDAALSLKESPIAKDVKIIFWSAVDNADSFRKAKQIYEGIQRLEDAEFIEKTEEWNFIVRKIQEIAARG